MVDEPKFVSVSLSREKYFSWVFLVTWILTCILCLLMFFYIDRVFAYSLTFILDWLLWRPYKVKIHCESIRLSLLSARISFKNLCIITENSTISILEGKIIWQYWLLNTRVSAYELHQQQKEHGYITPGSGFKNIQLPCKFLFQCEGAEIFVYNKTSAYENIIDSFSPDEKIKYKEFLHKHFRFSKDDTPIERPDIFDSKTMKNTDFNPTTNNNDKNNNDTHMHSQHNHQHHTTGSSTTTASTSMATSTINDNNFDKLRNEELSSKIDKPPIIKKKEVKRPQKLSIIQRLQVMYEEFQLNFYPFGLKLTKGSIIFGNKFTPSLLIISYKSAEGIVDVLPATNPRVDLYKMKMKLDFQNFEIEVKPNISYEDDSKPKAFYCDSMLSRLWTKFSTLFDIMPNPLSRYIHFSRLHKNSLFLEDNIFEDEDFEKKWKGLSLYKDAALNRGNPEEHIEFDFLNHEYARYCSIVKAPRLIFTNEYDIPGIVPYPEDYETHSDSTSQDISSSISSDSSTNDNNDNDNNNDNNNDNYDNSKNNDNNNNNNNNNSGIKSDNTNNNNIAEAGASPDTDRNNESDASNNQQRNTYSRSTTDNISAPPESNMEFQLFDASINYGPWAHRNIMNIQRIFSPIVSRTPELQPDPEPGFLRRYTMTKISVSIMEDSSWRVPTREPSKDQDFLKRYMKTNDSSRSFGWFDLNFSRNSEATFCISSIPDVNGYANKLNLDFKDLEVRSSVNHDIFFRSKSYRVDSDIGYPLGWNDEVTWSFVFDSYQLETFFLREHLVLIADTFSDFSSGEPTPYEFFRPSIYKVDWNFHGYSAYLNVNDHNIINNPLDFNENCYISVHGDDAHIGVEIPRLGITATYTDIIFQISTPMFRLLLNTPPWNTLNEFMRNKEIGRGYDFTAEGSYIIYSDLDIDNVDSLTIECSTRRMTLLTYGFVIGYLLNVQMNYFGEFSHFITAEEYTDIVRGNDNDIVSTLADFSVMSETNSVSNVSNSQHNPDNSSKSNIIDPLYNPPLRKDDIKRKVNETDIWFTFSVWEGALLLPEVLYNSDPCIALSFKELIIDFRNCDYYLDLLATLNGTSFKRCIRKNQNDIFELVHNNAIKNLEEHGSVSNISIHGHRMYGAPPTSPSYFSDWAVDVNNLSINSDIYFIRGFISYITKVGFEFSNLQNILLYDESVLDNMTSVTVHGTGIDILVADKSTSAQVLLNMDGITFNRINFANDRYSSRIDLQVPGLHFAFFDNGSSMDKTCLFEFKTKINFTNFTQMKDGELHSKKQQEFIALNDSAFHRCSFLLLPHIQESLLYHELYGGITPSSSVPPLPIPVQAETIAFIIDDFLGPFGINSTELLGSISTSTPIHSSNKPLKPPSSSVIHPIESMQSHLVPSQSVTHGNYIIDISYITLDINPLFFTYASNFLDEFYSENIIETIDGIEMAIVNRLGTKSEELDSVTNIKLQIKYLDFFFGQRNTEGLELYVDQIDLEVSQKTFQKKSTVVLDEIAILSRFLSLRASINEKKVLEDFDERPPALSLALEGWEGWSSTASSQVNSLNISSTDITVDESQIEWLIDYLNRLVVFVHELVNSLDSIQKKSNGIQKKLVSDLTLASEYYQISHDPYVITKPAYVMRVSKGHVRQNRSWRIVTRLRHIYTYLPDDWEIHVQEEMRGKDMNDVSDSSDIFLTVFSNWRNWEVSDVARSYIYKKIFLSNDETTSEKKLQTTVKLNLNSIFFTIYSTGYAIDHNIILTKAVILLELTTETAVSPPIEKSILNMTGSLGSIKGEFSDKFLRLLELIPDFSKEEDIKSLTENSSIVSEKSPYFTIHLFLLFENGGLQLTMGDTTLSNNVTDGKISALLEKSSYSKEFSYSGAYYMKKSEMCLKHNKDIIAEFQLHHLGLISTGIYTPICPVILINLRSADLHFKSLASTEKIVKTIEDITEYSVHLYKHYDLRKYTTKPTKVDQKPEKINFDVRVACNLSKVSAELTLISPFYLRYETKQLDLYFNQNGDGEILLSLWDTDIFVTSHHTKEQYFRFSYDDIQINCNPMSEKNKVLVVSLSASLVKLTFSEPRRIFASFLQDERITIESFQELKKLKKIFFSNAKNVKKLNNDVPKEDTPTKWALELNINYFGILLPIASTFFVLELHMLLGSLTNTTEEIQEVNNQISGQISLENILFLINDRSLPLRLSKLVDFSIRISTLQKTTSSYESLQIESSHFRMCFSPESLVFVLWGVKQLQNELEYYKDHKTKRQWNLSSHKTGTKSSTSESPLNYFRSIHILSYNFCIGWMLPENQKDIPGWMFGYDRLFSAYEKNYGKLTLIEGYMSVTNSNSSNDFFSQGEEKNRHNRSFLPSMQILYWLKEFNSKKDLFIRLHGDALDVDILSNFVNIIELIFKSYQIFEDFRKSKIVQNIEKQKHHEHIKSENATEFVPTFLSDINSINCEFKYEGGTLRVFSVDDVEIDSTPSLELNAPKVSIYLNYKHFDDSPKPHWLRCVIDIHSSHNILYSKCAPFVIEFVESIQEILENRPVEPKQSVSKIATPNRTYKRILAPFDIAFRIKAAKQMLSFSCEPSAKVQANVGLDSFLFGISTGGSSVEDPLSLTLCINKISTSVQHIFSKEASASFSLNFIDLTFIFTQPTLYCVGLISDIDIFFNMKQQQNLLLFLDIWHLSESIGIRPNRKKRKHKKHKGHTQIPETPQPGKIIPWNFNIIFTNVNADIHLGPALGIVSAKLEKTWFISDRYLDKRQILQLFTDGMVLKSRGRLSGMLDISNAGWRLEVNYADNELNYNSPIVAIGIDIGCVALKTAFDYHMFMISKVNNIHFRLHSERDPEGKLPDLLLTTLLCEEISICSTTLVASNILDIYNTIIRTRQDTKNSYFETLMESNNQDTRTNIPYSDILKSLNLLRTDVQIDVSKLQLQISPISLFDFEVLVINIDNMSARSETTSTDKLKTRLELQVCNASVALSTAKEELDEESVNKISVADYMTYASKIKGGTILIIPKLLVGMTTWQKVTSNTIEYTFTCKFDGKVSVRWNLGPVNFIKEMWATHVKSLAVRQARIEEPVEYSSEELESSPESIYLEPAQPKFTYVALVEPSIEMPQIKDLEDATPPMEWFGLNRKKFPSFTHQTAVIVVQKLVHAVEKEYAKIIGHSEQ
ncbi:hypothetical protein TBLA_0E04420 [Henningerozyma blattae CBS 6284]|uniref:Protein CSF1 n=1 Tax=Henningerozyma blattae (strain ATCC 34711 / CBS 6284 / DSM 70876 / NBRC 10599 / NRRL Y-10934 / UCD 77-7) TaxID=1071380 RepID=I2H544_HENB6|nr:hypothetical protein TBLA_0E04420 [Tetrapisispora blattae CBS 6284]CCH61496.1 hypothetical protein TBLA_0E04420 [Tetrapisispora blattae CBS 6284]